MVKKQNLKKEGKIFVLDTNVLLDDPFAFQKMGEHDVVIPMDVITELDKFKSQQSQLGEHAREVTREIDSIFDQKIFESGVSLGPGKGKLTLYLLKQLNIDIKKVLTDNTIDHRIISVALNLTTKEKEKEVVFVSNDSNLRFKAASFGIKVEAYKNDRIENIEDLYSGITIIEDCASEEINKIYSNKEETLCSDIISKKVNRNVCFNECFILKAGDQSVLVRYVSDNTIKRVTKKDIYNNVSPRNAEQTFATEIINDPEISLVTVTGKAGTGKTLVAIGVAIALLDTKKFDQVLIARPIVALSNKDLGYLPGDVSQKLGPYMQPLYDNISVLKKNKGETKKSSQKIDQYLKEEKIIVQPLAFIRGRSLNNTLFIIDESQNLTPREIKTIVTRMGEGSKVIFTGDVYQIDHPYLDAHSNGLTYLVDKAKSFKNAAHIEFKKGERSSLADWAADNL